MLFCFLVFVSVCQYCYAQDNEAPKPDSFNNDNQSQPAPDGTEESFASGARLTPDATEDASRAVGEFAKTLPNDSSGLVRIIKGLLQEHPPMSPHTWQTSYWRGRCFVSLDKLSLSASRCYVVWYHTIVSYEKYLASGSAASNNEFQKMRAIAERVCNDEYGGNPVGQSPIQTPSSNNKTTAWSPPSADSYNAKSPAFAPPSTAPPPTPIGANKPPPLAPQRRGATLPPVAPDNYNPSARDSQALPGQQSTSSDGPSIIQGEAGKHFATPSQALKSWATSVWPESKTQDVEFAGKLYQNWDGTWSYTPSYRGEEDSSHSEKGYPYVLAHGNPLKSYDIHSHGDYRAKVTRQDGSYYFRNLNPNERMSVDEFSPGDRFRSDRTGYPQFMLTPAGVLWEFIPHPIKRMGFGLFIKDGDKYPIGNLNTSNAWTKLKNLQNIVP